MHNALYPKLVVYEEKKDMELAIEHESPLVYVYAKGKLDSIYTNAAIAFNKANDIAGVVITENQNCIFERTRKYDKYQIEKVPATSVSENMDSLAACVKAVCEYYQISVDITAELSEGKSAQDVLKEALGAENVLNLYGQSLDNVLYMVSAGYPVIVKIDANNYGVIVGYNNLNTILMNPLEGKTGYVGIEDSRNMYSQAGNIFIGCVQ